MGLNIKTIRLNYLFLTLLLITTNLTFTYNVSFKKIANTQATGTSLYQSVAFSPLLGTNNFLLGASKNPNLSAENFVESYTFNPSTTNVNLNSTSSKSNVLFKQVALNSQYFFLKIETFTSSLEQKNSTAGALVALSINIYNPFTLNLIQTINNGLSEYPNSIALSTILENNKYYLAQSFVAEGLNNPDIYLYSNTGPAEDPFNLLSQTSLTNTSQGVSSLAFSQVIGDYIYLGISTLQDANDYAYIYKVNSNGNGNISLSNNFPVSPDQNTIAFSQLVTYNGNFFIAIGSEQGLYLYTFNPSTNNITYLKQINNISTNAVAFSPIYTNSSLFLASSNANGLYLYSINIEDNTISPFQNISGSEYTNVDLTFSDYYSPDSASYLAIPNNSTFEIDIYQLIATGPKVYLKSSLPGLCPNGSSSNLTAIILDANPGETYTYTLIGPETETITSSNSTASFTVKTPGTYYVNVRNSNNTIFTNSNNITLPKINLSVAIESIILNSSVELLANVRGGSGNYSYTWFNSNNTQIGTNYNQYVYLAGKYSVTITDNVYGCKTSANVTVNPETVRIVYTCCKGIPANTIVLQAMPNIDGNYLYTWTIIQPISKSITTSTNTININLLNAEAYVTLSTKTGFKISSSTLNIDCNQ